MDLLPPIRCPFFPNGCPPASWAQSTHFPELDGLAACLGSRWHRDPPGHVAIWRREVCGDQLAGPFTPRKKLVVRHLALTSGGGQGLSLQDCPFSGGRSVCRSLWGEPLTSTTSPGAGEREDKYREPLGGLRCHAAGAHPTEATALPSRGAPTPGRSHPVFRAPNCQRKGEACSPSLIPAGRVWAGSIRLSFVTSSLRRAEPWPSIHLPSRAGRRNPSPR